MRRVALLLASVIMGAALIVGACASPPASPAPAQTSAPAPAPKLSPLDEIIAGAKKEGAVVGRTGVELSEIAGELERAIKDKYGVDLRIELPRGPEGTARILTTAIMEYKTGATPTYDLLSMPSTYVPEAIASGAIETVDWRPLLETGLPPEFAPQEPRIRGSVFYKDGMLGLMYNPEKITAAEAPKTLGELVNPKWTGRLGIANVTARWVEWAFVLGKDKVFSNLRSLMKMKPLLEGFPSLTNRYMIGEIDLAWTIQGYVGVARARGMPAAFHSLDFSYTNWQYMLVPKGVKHPNAAKLIAIFLASADGGRFIAKNLTGGGRRDIPGTTEYDIFQADLKRGLLIWNPFTYPGMLDFMVSPDFKAWEKEADLILKGT